jgi:hypothetical protein
MYASYYGSPNQTVNNQIIHFMNYSNTTTYKSLLARGNNAASGTDAIASLWRSTAAITSITFNLQTGGTFDIGSTITLYGITAA